MDFNDGTTTKMRDQVSDKIDDARETMSQVKEKAADMGRRASNKIDAQRDSAARTLHNTAQRMQEGSESMTGVVSGAADKLHAAADYLRENDVRAMMGDVQDVVRRHPGPALAAAAAVGFLVARAFTSGRD